MRLLTKTLLLVGWGILQTSAGDDFAAVPGTGWTDIRELQSTCSSPGYFVNPSDCSRFYVCVDHSTAEHRLLLRYDFDCPGGLAFDESTKNCNYPGPSGCVSSGSGWGWSQPPQNGIWQSTATVSKVPNSWGTPTRNPVSTTTIIHRGHSATSSGGGPIIRGPSTPAPVPSNPRVQLPTVQILQIPITSWESLRLQPRPSTAIFGSQKVTHTSSESGGWSSSTKVVNPGVFQSATVTQRNPNQSVAWGTSKVIPVQNTGIFESARVTPVPHTEWETPQPFPQVVQQQVRQEHGSGWSSVRISSTPTPAPANPIVTQSSGWQGSRISSAPDAPVSWQQITQVQQQQPAPVQWNGPQAANPSMNFVQQSNFPTPNNPSLNILNTVRHPSYNVVQTNSSPTPSNPSLNFIQGNTAVNPSINVVRTNTAANPSVAVAGGWDNFRFNQLPAGYTWQSSPQTKTTETVVVSSPAPPTVQSPPPAPPSLSAEGDFRIVQQIIDEEQRQAAVNGKSHIQLVYENREKPIAQHQSQILLPQNQLPQEVNAKDPRNPVYEFVSSPDSGFKGRIIVLYAPLNNKGGKREVPVIEVEVEDSDDNNNNNSETDRI